MNTDDSPALETPLSLGLVRAAVLAPSPDNNQPWRFVSQGDRLLLYLDPQRSLPSDVNRMYDLMGLGAAVENVCVRARQASCEPHVDYASAPLGSAEMDISQPTATVTLASGGKPDPLFPYLATRCTCRKLYSTRSLSEDCLDHLAQAARRFTNVQLDWITDRPRIRSFARLLAVSDRFRFEYEPFHKEIFRQLRFSAQEAQRTRDGLDVQTLELPPGAGFILRRLRPWKRMELIHRLGLGRLLTLPSVLSVWKSGALGVLSIPEPAIPYFLEAGRSLQRIWLAADKENLALQPLGSLAIFLGQMEQLQGSNLTAAHRRLATRLGQRIRQIVPSIAQRTLSMVFRLGHASRPDVRSLRRPAEEVFVDAPATNAPSPTEKTPIVPPLGRDCPIIDPTSIPDSQ